MIHTQFLVIGQGIAGTWLSYWLHKAGKDFIVIDDGDPSASSRVAAGVVNPVTGRRYATTWMADALLPFCENAYEQLSADLGIATFSKKSIIDFFPTPQMRSSFLERIPENHYLQHCDDESAFQTDFNYHFGCGRIAPAYVVHLSVLLKTWRARLEKEARLLAGRFELELLRQSNTGIQYRDISADYLIFCDGQHNSSLKWFNSIPYALNKGEALIVEIKNLPADHLYKSGMTIVPLPEKNDCFWVGASYEWDFQDAGPSEKFRSQAESFLRHFLKASFKVTDHKAAIRPATLERRPFVGLHPVVKNVGLLNGLGTKGCSLAPYFAKQLCDHLLTGVRLDPVADVKRFTRVLSK